MQLTPEQQHALDTIVALRADGQSEIRLAGPAGTGKTVLIHALRTHLAGQDIEVVTPTNKAAKVLRSKGVLASTLYATFFTSNVEQNPPITPEKELEMLAAGDSPEDIEKQKRARREVARKLTFYPNYELKTLSEGKRSFADTIVVDESSMLQYWVLRHLRKMCNTLILVGDPHQLPPVNDMAEPKGYFCTRDAHVQLTTVMRQADGSPILDLATHIREGRFPEPLVRGLAPRDTFRHWIHPDRKVIAFTNAHRRQINHLARKALGFPSTLPKPSERLICNTNVDSKLLNGTEVEVVEFSWPCTKNPTTGFIEGDPTAKLQYRDDDGNLGFTLVNIGRFIEDLVEGSYPERELRKVIDVSKDDGEGASFSYAYCITAHKAQGSEWDEVCVIDERFVLGNVDPTGESARRWIYTAITRAAKQLVFADYRWIKASA